MKIHAVTPTRGDRPVLLERAKFYLSRQTLRPEKHHVIDFPPTGMEKDITKRFKAGITQAFAEGADLVFLWEDDDWYHPDYVKQMVSEWERMKRPNCIGIAETYYYHVGIKGWTHMRHLGRASAFCTAVTPAVLNMSWPDDANPFFDIELWKQLKGCAVFPTTTLAVGIKHGIGLSGGMGHHTRRMYDRGRDPSMEWLRQRVGSDIEFYKQLSTTCGSV